MLYKNRKKRLYSCMIALICASLCFTGCSSSADASDKKAKSSSSSKKEKKDLRDSTPTVLVPDASGTATYGDETILIDSSNTSQGYIMLYYNGDNEKVQFQLKLPDGTECTYRVTDYGAYSVYPLSGGDGKYTATVLESVSTEKNMYSVALTQNYDVTIDDEFLPYLYPNHYVNFTPDSSSVKKGQDLAEDCTSDLDVVNNIYDYVIKNISYDTEKAKDLPSGYTPVPDETLSTKTGICFDYASLMATMLRSQRIPTRLEVGYAGDAYHAWISCYVDEIGWVADIIEFDGENWSLMDPTLAANNKSSSVKKYIGDGSKYVVKYTY